VGTAVLENKVTKIALCLKELQPPHNLEFTSSTDFKRVLPNSCPWLQVGYGYGFNLKYTVGGN